ncbi:hypothetical protein [Paenibacillus senegalensis]|uniref:hypothetical protein n=1 Tax=Paenibacillus senegalensis TaxID=1465766 RepID=UPI0002894119|nr:hypothetical protein [Paenibacillus senegalensis]
MNQRRLLLTYGHDLDHSNIDFLVRERLAPYFAYGIDYEHPSLQFGAEFILNYQVYDTNIKKWTPSYYLNDYHLTSKQLSGFLYSLKKLKGTHVLCDPKVHGHHWMERDGVEYSTNVFKTVEEEYLYFLEFNNEPIADEKYAERTRKLPKEQLSSLCLRVPSTLNYEERTEKVNNWLDRLLLA